MEETYEAICKKILSRTTYGLREERVEHSGGRIIAWNAQRGWYLYYYAEKKGSVITLDDNQVLVYGKKKYISKMLEQLPMLPLFGNSFEAGFLE